MTAPGAPSAAHDLGVTSVALVVLEPVSLEAATAWLEHLLWETTADGPSVLRLKVLCIALPPRAHPQIKSSQPGVAHAAVPGVRSSRSQRSHQLGNVTRVLGRHANPKAPRMPARIRVGPLRPGLGHLTQGRSWGEPHTKRVSTADLPWPDPRQLPHIPQGVLHVAGAAHMHVVQAVRELYEIVGGRAWGGADRRMTRIVVIGYRLDKAALLSSFRDECCVGEMAAGVFGGMHVHCEAEDCVEGHEGHPHSHAHG